MRLGFPDAGNDPPDTMTRQAYDLNTEGFGPGTNGPLVIAAELPDRAAKAEIDSLAQRLRSEPGVAFVPPQINPEGDAAIVTVIPRGLAAGRGDRGPGQPAARGRRARRRSPIPGSPPRSAA